MSRLALTLLTAFIIPLTAESNPKSTTAIQKVIELLEGMATKGETDMFNEEIEFGKFQTWCDSTISKKKDEIGSGESKVESLTAAIEKSAVDIKKLSSRIEELEEDIGRFEQDLKSTSTLRDNEAEDFAATDKDYGESVDAVEGAIRVLEEKALDAPQALLQVQKIRMVPSSTKESIAALLDEQQADTDLMTDDPKAYNMQSGGVIKMLKDLKNKFETKRQELQVQEKSAIDSYDQIKTELTTNKEDAQREVGSKTTLKTKAMDAKATDEGDLAETKRELEEDRKYLAETTTLCQSKEAAFKKRTELRKEELATLRKATEILASDAVKGAGEKHLPKLVQTSMISTAFAVMRSQVSNPFQQEAIDFLAETARRSGSHILMQASQNVAANPFNKVKKMIKDLIVKLMEEATAEMEKKGFCDTEISTNKLTREAKSEEVLALQSDVDRLNAEIGQLTNDLSEVMAQIATLEDAMGSATMDRMKSKIENENAVTDAAAAQKAVDKAISMLRGFYEKAGKATSFVEDDPNEDAPKPFKEKSYNGMQSKGGGILDILEVILSDFQRLESDTAADEAQEVDEYDKFMLTSKKAKAMKEAALNAKTERKTAANRELTSTDQDLKSTQKELDLALLTYEKLKPTCEGSGASYEERAAQREEEMKSLKTALDILQKGNNSP